jgi:hypothetical protein
MVKLEEGQANTEESPSNVPDNTSADKLELTKLKMKHEVKLSELRAELEKQSAFKAKFGKSAFDAYYDRYGEAAISGEISELDERIRFLEPPPAIPTEVCETQETQAEKKDRRSQEWESAIPIAKDYCRKHEKCTLDDLRQYLPFSACFQRMPANDTLRTHLNGAGIHFASGRRPGN